MAFSVPANATVKEYLDIGSRGLLYFEKFEPRFTRAFNKDELPSTYAQLHKRFYEQNGMDEGKLRDLAAALQVALQVTNSELDKQRTQSNVLGSIWQGAAADSAAIMLNQQIDRASTDWKTANDAWKTIAAAGDALRTAVKIKAEVVRYILQNGEDIKIADKTPEDIDDIISGTSVGVSTSIFGDTLLDKLRKIFPDLNEGQGSGSFLVGPGDEYRKRINNRCQHWLDNVFKPDYLAKVHKFTDACDLTDKAVTSTYGSIINSMSLMTVAAYPRPAGAPAPDKPKDTVQPGNPAAPTVPASTTPAPSTPSTPSTPASPSAPSTPTVPASTVPTPSVPTTPTTPATPTTPTTPTVPNTSSLAGLPALSQVASQLSPLTSGISNLVESGINSLSGTVKDGVDNAVKMVEGIVDPTQVDKNGDGKPDGKPAAEFDVAGKHLKFEMADGQLKLVMSEADGKAQEFSVRLDEHGMPVIEVHEPKDPAPSATEEKHSPATDEKPSSASPGEKPSPAPGERPSPAPGAQPLPSDSAPAAPGQDKAGDKPHADEESTSQPNGRVGTPPPMRRGEDGEHRPKRLPGEQNPDAPFDSGAELAEAGPMGDLAEAGPL
ncbi:hypothetical protein ACFWF7_27325 [Nocardia sp. NPDC060256]|uniref:hypothetical protein n=1 Tax=unclassified Nocardia TaxID=2637762 RepID=UPI00365DE60B